MGHFDRDNRSGGNRSFGGGGRSFGGGDRGGFGGGRRPMQMHQAVCSKCGKDCEVPFRPTGDRPVFCSNCFEHEGKVSPGRFEGNKFDKPNFSKPSFGGGNFNPVAKSNEQFKAQFDTLNVKLDKILKALTPSAIEPHEEVKAIMFAEAKKEEKKDKADSVKTKAVAKKASTKKKK